MLPDRLEGVHVALAGNALAPMENAVLELDDGAPVERAAAMFEAAHFRRFFKLHDSHAALLNHTRLARETDSSPAR